jgi:hypothetical protein
MIEIDVKIIISDNRKSHLKSIREIYHTKKKQEGFLLIKIVPRKLNKRNSFALRSPRLPDSQFMSGLSKEIFILPMIYIIVVYIIPYV